MQVAAGPQDPHLSVGEGCHPCLHSCGGGRVEATTRVTGHAQCLAPIEMPLRWPLPGQSRDSGALSRACEGHWAQRLSLSITYEAGTARNIAHPNCAGRLVATGHVALWALALGMNCKCKMHSGFLKLGNKTPKRQNIKYLTNNFYMIYKLK